MHIDIFFFIFKNGLHVCAVGPVFSYRAVSNFAKIVIRQNFTPGRISFVFHTPVKKIGPGNSGFLPKRYWQRAEWPHYDGAVNPGWQGGLARNPWIKKCLVETIWRLKTNCLICVQLHWIHIWGCFMALTDISIFPAKGLWNAFVSWVWHVFVKTQLSFCYNRWIMVLLYLPGHWTHVQPSVCNLKSVFGGRLGSFDKKNVSSFHTTRCWF